MQSFPQWCYNVFSNYFISELKEGEPIPPCESPEVEDFMCVNSCENGRLPNNDSFPNICFGEFCFVIIIQQNFLSEVELSIKCELPQIVNGPWLS